MPRTEYNRRYRDANLEKIREHIKEHGSIAGDWVEWADDILKPPHIPWEQLLAASMRWAMNDVSGKVFHSYKRPSRRQHAVPDIVLPSMRRPVPSV